MDVGTIHPAGSAHRRAPFGALPSPEGRVDVVENCERSVPEISVEGVAKRYRSGTIALKDVSFTVQKGEFVTFLGPSGCGKSTVLRLVAGLGTVSEGVVRVNGMTPGNAREMMSFIFQDATLLPWRTVEQN